MTDNELTTREWMTARDAAKLLHVSERMIGHYAKNGKLHTLREGRNVWYSTADVQKLAQSLRADLRQTQITRQDVNEELIGYIRSRKETDQQFLETQQGMDERLRRIEERISQPPTKPSGPNWQVIATLAIVLAIALVVLAIVLKLI